MAAATAVVKASSFDVARFEALASERHLALGTPLAAVATTGSTNDDAMAAARAGAAHGATFVADLQTHGRGRRGRVWTSPAGQNLTFSIVLRPRLALARVTALPLVVGLCVRQAVAARLDMPVTVKWPNDVHAAGLKLAGVLVESQLQGNALAAVIVGVGVNVAMRDVPEDIRRVATSLALCGARDLEREALLADVLGNLAERLVTYEEAGLSPFQSELARFDALAGRRVHSEGAVGVARGIDRDGALLVESDAGELLRVIAGTVETA